MFLCRTISFGFNAKKLKKQVLELLTSRTQPGTPPFAFAFKPHFRTLLVVCIQAQR